jgi:peroxiredoxin
LNLLKSIFISGFVSWLALVSLYAFTQLARGTEPLLSWLGLALAAFSPLDGQATGAIHVWAGISLLSWLIYLRWYSTFRGRDAQAIKAGSPLPEFRLESLDGNIISSESFKARPHLLLFYRGNWCPFCTAQIEELAAAYRRLEAAGVTVVLISPQAVGKSQKLAARFDAPMVFMRDRDGTAAKQLGIYHEWGTPMGMQLLGYGSDTVLPTVILTDTQGNIVFSDQTDNYRIRPEPEAFESILEKLSIDT